MHADDFVPAGDLTVEYALPDRDKEVTAWAYTMPPQGAARAGRRACHGDAGHGAVEADVGRGEGRGRGGAAPSSNDTLALRRDRGAPAAARAGRRRRSGCT